MPFIVMAAAAWGELKIWNRLNFDEKNSETPEGVTVGSDCTLKIEIYNLESLIKYETILNDYIEDVIQKWN